MTKEDFCATCKGYCCNIYEHFIIGDNIELKRKSFFRKKEQFGVEPLKRVGKRCEYAGENGCIIKRENRPEPCLRYECRALIDFGLGKESKPPKKGDKLK